MAADSAGRDDAHRRLVHLALARVTATPPADLVVHRPRAGEPHRLGRSAGLEEPDREQPDREQSDRDTDPRGRDEQPDRDTDPRGRDEQPDRDTDPRGRDELVGLDGWYEPASSDQAEAPGASDDHGRLRRSSAGKNPEIQPFVARAPGGERLPAPTHVGGVEQSSPLGDVTRIRRRAAEAAAAGYAAEHGHPLEHPAFGRERVAARWTVSRRAAAAAVVVLMLLCAAVVAASVRRSPTVVDVPEATPAQEGERTPRPEAGDTPQGTGVPVGVAPDGAGANGHVVVHVIGQVNAPGVVVLAAGARAIDAITAAGGALPDADLASTNLARVLVDGEQVPVAARGAAPGCAPDTGAGAPAGQASAGPAGPLDLNAADVAALDGLPGVGPVLAQRIVDWREQHGRFSSVDELQEVTGIGLSVLESVRELVHVGR